MSEYTDSWEDFDETQKVVIMSICVVILIWMLNIYYMFQWCFQWGPLKDGCPRCSCCSFNWANEAQVDLQPQQQVAHELGSLEIDVVIPNNFDGNNAAAVENNPEVPAVQVFPTGRQIQNEAHRIVAGIGDGLRLI